MRDALTEYVNEKCKEKMFLIPGRIQMLKNQKSELVYKYLYLKKTQAIEEIMKNSGLDPNQIEYDDK